MGKVRVPLHGKPQGYAVVDTEATKGAVVGETLYRKDGTVVTEADLGGGGGGDGSRTRTLWELIQKIPENIKGLAALASDGWIRRDAGVISARALQAEDSSYDNTTSGLAADDVQAALDELADEKLDDAPSDGNFYGRRDGDWVLGGGGSGAMTLVGTATVAGSAATSLTLSSLDLDSDGHYHIVYALKNATGSAADIYLHYNGDTTSANYYNQYISGNSGITGARSNQPLITGMGGNEGVCGVITVTKGYDGKPRAIIQANRGAPSGIIMQMFGHAWNVASGVTSITLTATTANALAVGSYFKVFKLN